MILVGPLQLRIFHDFMIHILPAYNIPFPLSKLFYISRWNPSRKAVPGGQWAEFHQGHWSNWAAEWRYFLKRERRAFPSVQPLMPTSKFAPENSNCVTADTPQTSVTHLLTMWDTAHPHSSAQAQALLPKSWSISSPKPLEIQQWEYAHQSRANEMSDDSCSRGWINE